MINKMQTAIIRKDLGSLVINKKLLPTLLIVPLVFTVVLPSIFIMMIHFAPDSINDLQPLLDLLPLAEQPVNPQDLFIQVIFNNIMPVFFMLIPIMASTIMAASSFVGEKEKRTLETLLYCPLSLKQIIQAKIFSSFILSMLVSLSSFIIMILVVEAEVLLVGNSLLIPGSTWLVTMLLLSPAVTLMSITIIVRGSAKAQSMEESQQKAIFLILPIILLASGQFTGILLINSWLLLALGIVFAMIAGFLLKTCIGKLNYEILLKQS